MHGAAAFLLITSSVAASTELAPAVSVAASHVTRLQPTSCTERKLADPRVLTPQDWGVEVGWISR